MNRLIGALYWMLPGISIALVVSCGLVIVYRTRRTYVVVLIWLAIILLAMLFRQLLPQMAQAL